MTETIIRADRLTKRFKLFRRPADRLLDVVGLLRADRDGRVPYGEHLALDEISFQIARGEKVGLIGRNGAGKSTLLKLITKSIEPTSGVLEVKAATQALLSLGTGFHPDFTGRDNAANYLAQLGISGDEAEALIREIIDFAEIEEYIDQPVKTYSSGMAARLMFAASTVMVPDVLVIDEVLGVGDAYFASKSYDRIKNLCSSRGTTLLLVSHDIYSAAKICDRMIWVDRGRIKFDGPAKDTLVLYESSIKEQEEIRLRRKATLSARAEAGGADGGRQVLLELSSADGQPMRGSVVVHKADLMSGNEHVASVEPRSNSRSRGTNSVALVHEGSNWLLADETGRSEAIELANYGSPYHKGAMRIDVGADVKNPEIRLLVESPVGQTLKAVLYDDRQVGYGAGDIELAANRRAEWRISLEPGKLTRIDDRADAAIMARHGSGAIRIVDIDILDGRGKSARVLQSAAPVQIKMNYRRNDVSTDRNFDIIAAIHRDGVQDVLRIFETPLRLAPNSETGTITLDIQSFPLSAGNYTLTILVAFEGYYARNDGAFYSANPNVVDMLNYALEFSVVAHHPAYNGTLAIYTGIWTVRTGEARA